MTEWFQVSLTFLTSFAVSRASEHALSSQGSRTMFTFAVGVVEKWYIVQARGGPVNDHDKRLKPRSARPRNNV